MLVFCADKTMGDVPLDSSGEQGGFLRDQPDLGTYDESGIGRGGRRGLIMWGGCWMRVGQRIALADDLVFSVFIQRHLFHRSV